MTSQSNIAPMTPDERAEYGYMRAKTLAFEALRKFWDRRRATGWQQIDIARTLGKNPGWVSRTLRGPGNLTLRSIGELVEAMDGEIEISIHSIDDPLPSRPNYSAYDDFRPTSRVPAQNLPQPSGATPRPGSWVTGGGKFDPAPLNPISAS